MNRQQRRTLDKHLGPGMGAAMDQLTQAREIMNQSIYILHKTVELYFGETLPMDLCMKVEERVSNEVLARHNKGEGTSFAQIAEVIGQVVAEYKAELEKKLDEQLDQAQAKAAYAAATGAKVIL